MGSPARPPQAPLISTLEQKLGVVTANQTQGREEPWVPLGPHDPLASPWSFAPLWSELNVLGPNCPTDLSLPGILVRFNPPHPHDPS